MTTQAIFTKMELTVPDIIKVAKISGYLASNALRGGKLIGGSVNTSLPVMIYMERKAVEHRYQQDPSNSTDLISSANYLLWLCGPYANKALLIINNAICVPPAISLNPMSQTVTAGASVTFTVSATGTATLSYQWTKNSINIVGATSASYNIPSSVSGDAGSYRCTVSNGCGSVTSNGAALTVNAVALSFTIGWSATNPFVNTSTALTITNSQSVSFSSGANLIYSGSLVAFADKFVMWSWPNTEPAITKWSVGDPATVLNQGVMGDAVVRSVWTVGGLNYACSRSEMAMDTAADLRLIH